MSRRSLLYGAVASAILMIVMLSVFGPTRHPSFWFTPDQQADHLLRDQKFAAAAKIYTDPARQGVAFFRAGDFISAATAFSHAATPQAIYNQANSLVMLGKYDEAVKTYDRALGLRPDWRDAEENREIAVTRRDRLKTTGGDEIGGQLAPDKVVYEKGAKKSGETIQVNDGPPLNDVDLQALWLRRVQTKPADFLRAKFAYQSAKQVSGDAP